MSIQIPNELKNVGFDHPKSVKHKRLIVSISIYLRVGKARKNDIEELFLKYFGLNPEEEGKVKYMMYGKRDNLDENEKKNYDMYKFLFTIRELSLVGYFTSEKVGTEVLNFDPIPGEYLPCIPVSDIGNAWTI